MLTHCGSNNGDNGHANQLYKRRITREKHFNTANQALEKIKLES